MSEDTALPAHTPEPWNAQPDASSRAIFIYGPDGNAIASVRRRWRGNEEQKANASFIVRACNAHEGLVEALRDLLASDFYVDGEGVAYVKNCEDPEHRQIVKAAQAAIVKAEGEPTP